MPVAQTYSNAFAMQTGVLTDEVFGSSCETLNWSGILTNSDKILTLFARFKTRKFARISEKKMANTPSGRSGQVPALAPLLEESDEDGHVFAQNPNQNGERNSLDSEPRASSAAHNAIRISCFSCTGSRVTSRAGSLERLRAG